jgi:hypothetical protein
VTFLDETFTARAAPPQHRLHQKATQAVLKALLPESGTDIKGHMRSQQELLEASGYANRPKEFDELLRILDRELRLITPTDPEGKAEAAPSSTHLGAKYYQLTHDHLVPALRAWLTRKQKETRHGRAELRLAERAALWNAKPENRHLPAWWEWLTIRLYTRRASWTPPQRRLMRQGARWHGTRLLLLLKLLTLTSWAGWEGYGRLRAQALVDKLAAVDTAQAPPLLEALGRYRRWAEGDLRRLAAQPPESREHLHAALALLPDDPGQVDYLRQRLLARETRAAELLVLRDALLPHKDNLNDNL